MKAKYRNILIGTAVAAVLGTSGAAFAHGGAYGGNMQQGAQAQQGCGGPGMGMGMMSGMMGSGGMMGHRGMMGSGGMMNQGGMMNHGGMMGGKHQGMGMGAGMGLDLSDDQKAEMSKIRDEFLPRMGELRGKMQANHEQLRALRQSGSADQGAIAALADQKGDLMAEMIKMRTSHQARMQALLTDEQREQMRQRRHGMGMGMGQMGG